MSKRKLNGESIERSVTYGNNHYLFIKRFYYLDNGEQYHYIHVHKNRSLFPVRRFTWAVRLDRVVEIISVGMKD